MPVTSHDLSRIAALLNETEQEVKQAHRRLEEIIRRLAPPLAFSTRVSEADQAIFHELLACYHERARNTAVLLVACDEWLGEDHAGLRRAALQLRVREQAASGEGGASLPPAD